MEHNVLEALESDRLILKLFLSFLLHCKCGGGQLSSFLASSLTWVQRGEQSEPPALSTDKLRIASSGMASRLEWKTSVRALYSQTHPTPSLLTRQSVLLCVEGEFYLNRSFSTISAFCVSK